MDPTYFGLSEHPFKTSGEVEPDLLNEARESLYSELRAGLKAPHGITLLIGEAGTGKTVLAKSLAGRLADVATVAYLPMTGPGLRHLLSEAIEQLGGDVGANAEEPGLIETLKAIAKARAEHGRASVIIVDDGHELPAKTLERLNRLFGDDPAEPSMLHVILVGRQELLDRINAANDRSILKHLIQVCRMDPIGPEQSFRYIADRVSRVGGVVKDIFTPEALDRIITLANGVPHRIDEICAASLEQAQERGASSVDADAVASAGGAVAAAGAEETGDGTQQSFTLGELPPAGDGAVSYASARGPLAQWRDLYENRRQLVLWGIGVVAVLAASAALLTGTPGEEETTPPTGEIAALATGEPAASAPAGESSPGAATGTEPAEALGEPASAPKLLLQRRPEAGATRAESASARERSIIAPPSRKTDFGLPASKAAPAASGTQSGSAKAKAPVSGGFAARAPSAPARVSAATPSPPPAAAPSKPARSNAKPAASAKKPPAAEPAKAQAKPKSKARPESASTSTAARSRPARPAAASKTVASPPAVVAGAAKGTYSVQIGAFGSRANAEKLLAKHGGMFVDGRIVPVTSGGKRMYRVVSGAFATKSEAAQREIVLKRGGYRTFVRKN